MSCWTTQPICSGDAADQFVCGATPFRLPQLLWTPQRVDSPRQYPSPSVTANFASPHNQPAVVHDIGHTPDLAPCRVLPDSSIVWPTRRQRAVRGDQDADQSVSPSTTRSSRLEMHRCPAPIAITGCQHECRKHLWRSRDGGIRPRKSCRRKWPTWTLTSQAGHSRHGCRGRACQLFVWIPAARVPEGRRAAGRPCQRPRGSRPRRTEAAHLG